MKTLKAIQTLSKIGKVLSKIVYICCMIGFFGCAAGIVAIFTGERAIKIGGITLHGILQTEIGVGKGTICAAIAVGMILCVGEFFVCRMAHRYFANELKAGTPFTAQGAKELLRLGISTIWIPIVSAVLAQAAQEVIARCMENVETVVLGGFDSVALGVMFIIMSLLCKYGAELEQKNKSSKGVDQ